MHAAVEFRKAVDTRSSRWILGLTALSGAAAAVLVVLRADPGGTGYAAVARETALFMTLFVPVVGILLVTGEWSHRTTLSTFTLVPRRGRVVVAKVLAGVALGVFSAAVCALVAAGAALVDGGARWDGSVAGAGYLVVWHVGAVVSGVAWGLLFLNTPAAIVVRFTVGPAFAALTTSVAALHGARDWLDTSTTWTPLLHDAMTPAAWARFAVSSLVWIALPFAVGMWRVRTRDIA
jgi:hypothetical protein